MFVFFKQENTYCRFIQQILSIYVWGCFSRYGVGLLKKIYGHLNSHKYQSEIISDIDIMGQSLVFPVKEFIF